MNLNRTSPHHPATRMGVRVAAVTLLLIGGFALKGHPVSAATQNGVATITDPVTAQPDTTANASTQKFSIALPAQAACSGDTQNNGFHVYSFLDHSGTDVTSITFNGSPSAGFGLVDDTGTLYGPANTAATTGQVINIPTNFQMGPLVTPLGFNIALSDLLYSGTTGSWDAGLVCADTNGKVTDWWTTNVMFTASATDPGGFTWTAGPSDTTSGGATTTSTTAPSSVVTTTTKPPKTTTTLKDPTTTTTKPADTASTTTTTIAGTGGTVPVTDSGAGTVDPVTGFDSGTTSGTLPRTGSPVHRELGLGLFAIGAGFMLIGLDLRWKARGAFVS
jgi:hypothetical protein